MKQSDEHPMISGRCSRSGQSLIESFIIIILMGLIFMGLFQLSQLFAAKEFLNYAAARGARARTVGFNDFMVWKTVRLGTIPNAGLMISPELTRSARDWSTRTPTEMWSAWGRALRSTPASEQFAVENSRMPLYLGGESHGRLPAILDYEDWDTVNIPDPVEDNIALSLSQSVSQDYPLRIPLHRAFYAEDTMMLSAETTIENHYPLYLTPTEF